MSEDKVELETRSRQTIMDGDVVTGPFEVSGGLGFIGSILGGVFAAGGTDFTTRGPTLLIVGDNPGRAEETIV